MVSGGHPTAHTKKTYKGGSKQVCALKGEEEGYPDGGLDFQW